MKNAGRIKLKKFHLQLMEKKNQRKSKGKRPFLKKRRRNRRRRKRSNQEKHLSQKSKKKRK